MNERRIVIVGAGPAGLAAALQLTRQGQNFLLLEGDQPGGLLHNANLVENYPGFPGGISGPELVDIFLEQAQQIGVQITPGRVDALDYRDNLFQLETDQGRVAAEIAVIATGTIPKIYRDVDIPADLRERVYYEVVPIRDAREKRILIIGAGDAALDYALNLARENQVTILNRGEEIQGLSLLWDRVKRQENITYYGQRSVTGIQSSREGRLSVETVAHGDRKTIDGDYLIPAIGRRPAVDFIDEGILEQVELLIERKKLFFIGDVKNGYYRQTAIAVGDGLKAAMVIDRNIAEE